MVNVKFKKAIFITLQLTSISCFNRIKGLGKRILSFWLLHASLVRPLSETGKLKLISDMSQLEYSLNQLLIDNGLTLADLDDEYKALKSFRLVYIDCYP
jgi:hypothetical protein